MPKEGVKTYINKETIITTLAIGLILFLCSQYFRSGEKIAIEADKKADKALVKTGENKQDIKYMGKFIQNIEGYMVEQKKSTDSILDKVNNMEKDIIRISYESRIVNGYKVRYNEEEGV